MYSHNSVHTFPTYLKAMYLILIASDVSNTMMKLWDDRSHGSTSENHRFTAMIHMFGELGR